MSKRIAVIAPAYAWLPGEAGTSRFSYLASFLSKKGYKVDLIGSTFGHFDKALRDIDRLRAMSLPYNLVFISEPGYKKNVDVRRIYSNYFLARNTLRYLKNNIKKYDLVYCVIPPNVLSAKVSRFCHENNVPCIIDVEDLWPEAMKMVFKLPIISNILFYPYRKDARTTYRYAKGVVGTSDEYTMRAFKERNQDIPMATVYVGCELENYDTGVTKYADNIEKPKDEFWVTYAGSIGASYDIKTLIDAAGIILRQGRDNIKFYILGTGSLKEEMETYAKEKGCSSVTFEGYVEYQKMAAFLSKSDILINSYIKNAPQSIVTKVGDYLSSGRPMINTLGSEEFCRLVKEEGFGLNVEAENPQELADAIDKLYGDDALREEMGRNARSLAERKFDRKEAYMEVVRMIEGLTGGEDNA